MNALELEEIRNQVDVNFVDEGREHDEDETMNLEGYNEEHLGLSKELQMKLTGSIASEFQVMNMIVTIRRVLPRTKVVLREVMVKEEEIWMTAKATVTLRNKPINKRLAKFRYMQICKWFA